MPSITLSLPVMPESEVSGWIRDQLQPLLDNADDELACVTLDCNRSIPAQTLVENLRGLAYDLGFGVIEFCERQQKVWLLMPGSVLKNEIEMLFILDLKQNFLKGFAGSSLIPLQWRHGRSVMRAQREVNVGFWRHRPTVSQMQHPVANRLPAPDLWIEVFNDFDHSDKERALSKPDHVREMVAGSRRRQPEFVAVGLPQAIFHHANPVPTGGGPFAPVKTTKARARAPYVVHWPPGQQYPDYYNISHREEQLDLFNGDFHLKFCRVTDVLGQISGRRFVTIDEFNQVKNELERQERELNEVKRELNKVKRELNKDKAKRRKRQ